MENKKLLSKLPEHVEVFNIFPCVHGTIPSLRSSLHGAASEVFMESRLQIAEGPSAFFLVVIASRPTHIGTLPTTHGFEQALKPGHKSIKASFCSSPVAGARYFSWNKVCILSSSEFGVRAFISVIWTPISEATPMALLKLSATA